MTAPAEPGLARGILFVKPWSDRVSLVVVRVV